MSANFNFHVVAGQVLLRWSDSPNAPQQEELAQLLETHLSEAVLRSALKICEKTKVYLKSHRYVGGGTVRSCCPDGPYFVLRISMDSKNDPGVLSVDQFLTEEDELRILEELSRQSGTE